MTIPFYYDLILEDPIETLKYLYAFRRDLQEAYPDDDKNNFHKLIDWAVTSGVVYDSHKNILIPHFDYFYNHCSEQVKPLAKK